MSNILGNNVSGSGGDAIVTLAAKPKGYKITSVHIGADTLASATTFEIYVNNVVVYSLPLSSPGPAPITFDEPGLLIAPNVDATFKVTANGASVMHVNVFGMAR